MSLASCPGLLSYLASTVFSSSALAASAAQCRWPLVCILCNLCQSACSTFAGVAFSSYGGFWLGYGIFGILSSSGVFNAPPAQGIQMALALWAIFTACLWAQVCSQPARCSL